MGIALGTTGCFGRTSADGDPGDDALGWGFDGDPDAAVDHGPREERSPSHPMGGPEPDVVPPEDTLVAAFCDATWPPTKGSPEPETPMCIDPGGECVGAPLPNRCYALLAEDTCDLTREWMDPLHCIDGEWHCPPGATSGWECVDDACESTCKRWATPDQLGLGGAAGNP